MLQLVLWVPLGSTFLVRRFCFLWCHQVSQMIPFLTHRGMDIFLTSLRLQSRPESFISKAIPLSAFDGVLNRIGRFTPARLVPSCVESTGNSTVRSGPGPRQSRSLSMVYLPETRPWWCCSAPYYGFWCVPCTAAGGQRCHACRNIISSAPLPLCAQLPFPIACPSARIASAAAAPRWQQWEPHSCLRYS